MTEKYEYHKQNDYPGERVAEKKRVAEREEAADKRSDARVAEKGRTDELKADNRVARRGRMDDELMDSEIERSTARAKKVNIIRNNADIVGLVVIASILVILLVGFGWGYMALRQQADKIDSLNLQIANSGNAQSSNANKQIQLYKDFLVLTADVKEEVNGLEQYNNSYSSFSSTYQICANFMERSNNINRAMNRFAEKELIYYRQIAVLADKSQCNIKIDKMNETMILSQNADEKLYIQNMDQCGRLINSTTDMIGDRMAGDSTKKLYWEKAVDEAAAKAKSFTNAERAVIACFA